MPAPDLGPPDLAAPLTEAWRQYRGWAASSRALKAQIDRQARLTFGFGSLTAALAAFASLPTTERPLFAFGSAAAGAFAGWFGQYVLDPKAQEQWTAARAAAEAIQSECYRYAASTGDYAQADARRRFLERVAQMPKKAEEVGVPYDAEAAAKPFDKPPPAMGLSAAEYSAGRLASQAAWYTKNSAAELARARRARWMAGGVTGVGVALGILTGAIPEAWTAPFIGMMAALASALAAYSMVERHQFLASSYAGVARQLGWLKARHASGDTGDDDMVSGGEDLLTAEHRAWAIQITRSGTRSKDQNNGLADAH